MILESHKALKVIDKRRYDEAKQTRMKPRIFNTNINYIDTSGRSHLLCRM